MKSVYYWHLLSVTVSSTDVVRDQPAQYLLRLSWLLRRLLSLGCWLGMLLRTASRTYCTCTVKKHKNYIHGGARRFFYSKGEKQGWVNKVVNVGD